MSEYVLTEFRKGFYLDSVVLMRLSREIAAMDGIVEAALMMGSPSNIAIMRDAGLLKGDAGARSNDLVLALRARSEAAAKKALSAALRTLERPKGSSAEGRAWRPRTLAAAVREVPDANLALISVPGEFAAAEARKALRRGLNVLMFSDNVLLEDELSLKEEARDFGLLMMGPDCGTAIINGVPLAFANRLQRGSIGIIGASGTGVQEVSCLISEAGGGISHAIGVGGRDLKREIGGITTLMAMDALDADESTDSVVLISKPPHPEVARKVIERIAHSSKPYTVCFIGAETLDLPGNARQAHTLRQAAELAMGGAPIASEFDIANEIAARRARVRPGGRIEGLFSGGTLCAEAQVVLQAGGRKLVSNAAISGVKALSNGGKSGADRIVDLGAEEYTRGRPHPMIDPSVRDDLLRAALEDPQVAVILVDLVIGYGAHADPAAHLAGILGGRREAGPVVVGSVTGTRLDPQNCAAQIARLAESGVAVAPSNAHACELALALVAAAD